MIDDDYRGSGKIKYYFDKFYSKPCCDNVICTHSSEVQCSSVLREALILKWSRQGAVRMDEH